MDGGAIHSEDVALIGWTPEFEELGSGDYVVRNVRFPSGAYSWVSRNYPDGKWRIVSNEPVGGWATSPRYDTRLAAGFAAYAASARPDLTIAPISIRCPVCFSGPGTPCDVPTDNGRRPVLWFHLDRLYSPEAVL